ncbi:unnamed protein product [Notodromas monacha]|uniref:Cyclin-like domain-containing protein n=1 Tax=Notodromas monacha TaxID=399045 RepID=A0A7R9BT91_9CRUS|nr:unnamed protein product [Notodromas monacha]CAG0920255.1 unnamed protein product [Notodromas monacha]
MAKSSSDSGKGRSLMCYEKLESCRTYADPEILADDRALENLISMQDFYTPRMDYFEKVQNDIKPYMRKIVANWMLEVCEEQGCPEEVFASATNYMDRFLCTTVIKKSTFQLIGTTCLLVASKVWMKDALKPRDLVMYTDDSISHDQLMCCELLVLARLRWDLNATTGHDFVDPIIYRLSQLLLTLMPFVDTEQIRLHARVFITLCATDHNFSRLPPGLVAAAAVAAAAHGLYYSKFAAATSVAPRRRSCHEEDMVAVDDEDVDMDVPGFRFGDDSDEDRMLCSTTSTMTSSTSAVAFGLKASSTGCRSLDDSGTCSIVNGFDGDENAMPTPQFVLDCLLVRLEDLTKFHSKFSVMKENYLAIMSLRMLVLT